MATAPAQCDLLLIEDNADHAELILSCLRECRGDIRVTHLADGEQALQYLRRQGAFADPIRSPRPTLIVLDLRMPKVDGLEVLRHLKDDHQLKRIPVVVLSTSMAKIDVSKAYDRHANSYLIKPSNYDALRSLVNSLDDYWLGCNYSPQLVGDDDIGVG